MIEFVQALHAAFHTDSRFLFILYIALGFGLFGAALAYVVDSGYQRAIRERVQSQPVVTVVGDTAEENRLRNEVEQLSAQLKARTDLQHSIQDKLNAFVQQGLDLRKTWISRLNGPEAVQRQSAEAVQKWHQDVENYLRTIPRGSIWLGRFRNQESGLTGYPIGMNMNLSGWWSVLLSDLSRLNEFITDPDLGKP
jgi:hypothetical protein